MLKENLGATSNDIKNWLSNKSKNAYQRVKELKN